MTTLRIPRHEIGRRSAELLVNCLRGAPPERLKIDVGFEIVQRDSTEEDLSCSRQIRADHRLDPGARLAIAGRLAAPGCNIMLNGSASGRDRARRQLEAGDGVRGSTRRRPRRTGPDRRLVRRRTRFGGIDILVNNAVVRYFAPIEQFKPGDWDHALAVNLSAPFHIARLALPGCASALGPDLNILIYGLRAAVHRVGYVTTKTALIGMTRAVALETAAQNITCNAICPGTVPTPYRERLAAIMAKGTCRARRRRRLSCVAPAVRHASSTRRRRRPGRLPVRTGRRATSPARRSDRRRLERQLRIPGSDTMFASILG